VRRAEAITDEISGVYLPAAGIMYKHLTKRVQHAKLDIPVLRKLCYRRDDRALRPYIMSASRVYSESD